MFQATVSLSSETRTIILNVELAIFQKEKNIGLMHRESLKDINGMLFMYTKPSYKCFWMANTKIPLDITFFDSNGHCTNIEEGIPLSEKDILSANSDCTLVLETNKGFLDNLNTRIKILFIHKS